MNEGHARYGLVGQPVAHSLSPVLFQWLHAERSRVGPGARSCAYDLLAVPPDGLADFLRAAGDRFDGLNVTVPHKVAVAALCDRSTRAARLTGAVNAVRFTAAPEPGRWELEGTNTDVDGFALALAARRPKIAAILGAGGAARSVVAALAARGPAEIRIVHRSPARAEALRAALSSIAPALVTCPFEHARDALAGADLIVQATSAGLGGQPALPPLPWSASAPAAVAMDLVYRPRRTPFLEAAAEAGLETIDGLEMLAGQAVGALAFFERVDVPPDAARLAGGLAARLRAAVD